jgi:ABC-type Mn2+/Zn2+ transport system permease subunit
MQWIELIVLTRTRACIAFGVKFVGIVLVESGVSISPEQDCG